MTVVGELGWSDKSGKRMGFIHYSHDYVWSSLNQQERRTVKYVRDMVTGLKVNPVTMSRTYFTVLRSCWLRLDQT